jgi:hypothetical protein
VHENPRTVPAVAVALVRPDGFAEGHRIRIHQECSPIVRKADSLLAKMSNHTSGLLSTFCNVTMFVKGFTISA